MTDDERVQSVCDWIAEKTPDDLRSQEFRIWVRRAFEAVRRDAIGKAVSRIRRRIAQEALEHAAALSPRVAEMLRALGQRLEQDLNAIPDEAPDTCRCGLNQRCADALADEVAALVTRGVLDSRSTAADALLDYRDPPRTPRSDRIAELERRLTPRGAPCTRDACDQWSRESGYCERCLALELERLVRENHDLRAQIASPAPLTP